MSLIDHIVLFKWKPEATSAQIDRAMAARESAREPVLPDSADCATARPRRSPPDRQATLTEPAPPTPACSVPATLRGAPQWRAWWPRSTPSRAFAWAPPSPTATMAGRTRSWFGCGRPTRTRSWKATACTLVRRDPPHLPLASSVPLACSMPPAVAAPWLCSMPARPPRAGAEPQFGVPIGLLGAPSGPPAERSQPTSTWWRTSSRAMRPRACPAFSRTSPLWTFRGRRFAPCPLRPPRWRRRPPSPLPWR